MKKFIVIIIALVACLCSCTKETLGVDPVAPEYYTIVNDLDASTLEINGKPVEFGKFVIMIAEFPTLEIDTEDIDEDNATQIFTYPNLAVGEKINIIPASKSLSVVVAINFEISVGGYKTVITDILEPNAITPNLNIILNNELFLSHFEKDGYIDWGSVFSQASYYIN